MENLQELVGHIEEIKDKISDKEYKDILEIAKKMNEEKDIGKLIKVKQIKFKSILAYQKEFSTQIITNIGNDDMFSYGTKCCNDEECDCNHEEKIISLQTRHYTEITDLILKVVDLIRNDYRETNTGIDIKNGQITKATYEKIKKDIYYEWENHNYIYISDL